ncbi:hypothetical protein ACQ5SO_11585 [Rhodovulum sp. DZ06]|uniref:hypothetical protein n=1 Tax=Rhodovulum sp. DZ06 TaxID=3425126 RepID=UPI003D330495
MDEIDDDDRLAAWLQGRLAPAERAAFEARLASDPALRAEAETLRAAAAALGAAAPPAGAKAAGWARLSAAIEDDRRMTPANSNRRAGLLRMAAAAALAVGAWQVAVVPNLPASWTGGGGYAPVTAPAPTEGPTLRVAFAPGAAAAQITALLQEVGAEVTGGPGALGLYRLRFADAAARDAAAETLAARTALVVAVAPD